jgi:hypothetical protein
MFFNSFNTLLNCCQQEPRYIGHLPVLRKKTTSWRIFMRNSAISLQPCRARKQLVIFPEVTKGTGNHEHISALIELARDCRDVCDQLLETIRKLKIRDGRWRRFRSLRAALEAAWDGHRIAELESRLDRYQKVILFHFFPIIRYFRTVIVPLSYLITDK